MTTDPERLHLPSASATYLWSCVGSQNLIAAEGYPSEPPDEWAEAGTVLHEAFETGNTIKLTEEQEDTYKQGVGFLEQLLNGWQAETQTLILYTRREVRLWLHSEDTLEPITSAKLDFFCLSAKDPGEDQPSTPAEDCEDAFLCDFKTGFVPNLNPSPRNTQLRVQALCLKAEYPNLKRIRVAFCKPKLKYGASDYCDYGEEDLRQADAWLRLHLWQAKQPDAPRTPGQHCRYCPVKSACPECAAYSLLPSVIASRAMPISKGFDADQAVAKLAPADLVKIFQSANIIDQIVKAVKSRLKGMTDDELRALDLERGKGRETWRVAKNAECIAYLLAQGWTQEQVFACIKFSNEALADTMRKEKGLPSDKAASAFMKKELKEFATVDVAEPPLRTIKPF